MKRYLAAASRRLVTEPKAFLYRDGRDSGASQPGNPCPIISDAASRARRRVKVASRNFSVPSMLWRDNPL